MAHEPRKQINVQISLSIHLAHAIRDALIRDSDNHNRRASENQEALHLLSEGVDEAVLQENRINKPRETT